MALLDTDIVVDILRGYPPALTWLAAQAVAPTLPGFVVLELMEGCTTSLAMRRLQKQIASFSIVWSTEQDLNRALAHFPRIWLSHRVDILDVLIAESAIGLGVPLCTFNVRHFRAVPGLVTEQPYQRI